VVFIEDRFLRNYLKYLQGFENLAGNEIEIVNQVII